MVRMLSMFDGIGCAAESLRQNGVELSSYVSYEIEKRLHPVVRQNFPNVQSFGDVCEMSALHKMPKSFDLLVAGSPCQGFSKIGKGLAFDDPRSKLYFEFERTLTAIDPKWWLLENVVMSKEHMDFISGRLGVKPLKVSAVDLTMCSRPRLYWTNVPVGELQVSGSLDARDAIDWTNQTPNSPSWHAWFQKNREQRVGKQYIRIIDRNRPAKGICQTARQVSNWNGNVVELDMPGTYRFCTPEELEIMQGLPVGFTAGLPKSHRYKALGNAWSVHITRQILKRVST